MIQEKTFCIPNFAVYYTHLIFAQTFVKKKKKKKIDPTLVKLMLHLPPKKKCLFQVEEIHIGISSKAPANSHMMHEKLRSKGTHSLYTFIKSVVKK